MRPCLSDTAFHCVCCGYADSAAVTSVSTVSSFFSSSSCIVTTRKRISSIQIPTISVHVRTVIHSLFRNPSCLTHWPALAPLIPVFRFGRIMSSVPYVCDGTCMVYMYPSVGGLIPVFYGCAALLPVGVDQRLPLSMPRPLPKAIPRKLRTFFSLSKLAVSEVRSASLLTILLLIRSCSAMVARIKDAR